MFLILPTKAVDRCDDDNDDEFDNGNGNINNTASRTVQFVY